LLIVISDIHLWDGTIGLSMTPQTFSLFASRLRELAYQASWRGDGKYRPVENIDILLLGDILDPLQSTRWHDETDGFVRPWSDVHNPLFAKKLGEITRAILECNSHALEIFTRLVRGEAIRLPPADSHGKPDFYTQERFAPKVRIHYMVGNHDWYYHIPGPAFDAIRFEIVRAFSLSNHVGPFPHDSGESGLLTGLLIDYELVARHGDVFDRFTYNHELGRNAAALSDIYSSEVIFRFPLEVERQLAGEIPPALLTAARQMTSVRPLLAAPVWMQNQIRSITSTPRLEKSLKNIWNSVIDDFLKLDAVHDRTRGLGGGELQALRLLLMLSQRTSFQTMVDMASWLQKNMWGGELSIARFAYRERDIIENRANYVVYGHTHSHEVISLDNATPVTNEARRVYVNTGTWGAFHDVASPKYNRAGTRPLNLVTCVAYYKDNECNGRRFEPWWANFA
jgi:UDP-2,3-diacylglucosamine pyrophosphatase LpxH